MRRTPLLAVVTALVLGVLAAPATAHRADAAPTTFVHPGVTVSQGQLDFARSKVQAGAQPWKAAYDQMMASKYADLNRTPQPRATVECGWSLRVPMARFHAMARRVTDLGAGLRSGGSGALGLVEAAAGRIDAYLELHINAWDAAAAMVIAREAILNDGGVPDVPADALVAAAGARGVVVQVGRAEVDPAKVVYAVRFEAGGGELGPMVGCLPDELTQDPAEVRA